MSNLTDLEICKRIADIEDIHYMETKYTDRANFLGLVDAPDGSGTPPELIGEYNPLKDDALCFQLMVKYDVPPMKNTFYDYYECIYSDDVDFVLSGGGSATDKSPNKAICLAIIEANKLTLQKESKT